MFTNHPKPSSPLNESNKWDRAIIYDWIKPEQGIEKVAITSAKECNFCFILNLLLFCEGRALFFCPSVREASQAVTKCFISMAANTVYLTGIIHWLTQLIRTSQGLWVGLLSRVFLLTLDLRRPRKHSQIMWRPSGSG